MKPSPLRATAHRIVSAVAIGAVVGVLTAVTVILYKVCAAYLIDLSANGYEWIRTHIYLLIPLVILLFGIAKGLAVLYRSTPALQGGGIPASIGILHGVLSFHWLKVLVGTFLLSLFSFLLGVPLGNEGPSVQIGTALGRGWTSALPKRFCGWDRLAMTGGACSGFATATGAPISGILFAIEEVDNRLHPLWLTVVAVSVLTARITTELLAPLCQVSVSLFPHLQTVTLPLHDLWIPAVIGIVMGAFAVVFLTFYRALQTLFLHRLGHIGQEYRLFTVLLLTVACGMWSLSFVSTGHHLINDLFSEPYTLSVLITIVTVRSILTISANVNGCTGGTFIPLLAIGAGTAALFGNLLSQVIYLPTQYGTLIAVCGIVACIAGIMKMPLTAVAFALEALSCHNNIPAVVITAIIAFAIPKLLHIESINEMVLARHKNA